MKATLAAFAQSCGGQLIGADAAFSGVSTDSRTVNSGELFVALSGPRFNGEDYVAAAVARGAAGAVVRTQQASACSQILVEDTLTALARGAKAWREGFAIPLVGVAGSNGKTTVKELISSILSQVGPCLSTRGNLNNHIGVPLTLFRINADHRFAVVEMGADRAGEVATLVSIGRPTIGIITNAGAEHLAGFGSLEGVARAEGEMVAGLSAQATAVINHDDPFALLWKNMTPAQVSTFGLEPGADFTAGSIRTTIDESGFVTHFTLHAPQGSVPAQLHLAGRHNLINALGAAAAASAAGVGQVAIHAVQTGSTRATGVCWSMNSLTITPHGVVPARRQGRSRASARNQSWTTSDSDTIVDRVRRPRSASRWPRRTRSRGSSPSSGRTGWP